MSYVLPTIGAFKEQFPRDFPLATPLYPKGVTNAALTVSINNAGGITGFTVVTTGAGYKASDTTLVVYGGGGLAASGTPVLTADAITGGMVTNAGYGYKFAPFVYVAVGDNTDAEKVTDYDIARALQVGQINLNTGLWAAQASFTYAYNLLAAHYLCASVIAGTTGLYGKAEWVTKAKQVGNVHEQFDIPDRVLNSPILSKLSKTTYGAQFLELVSPQLIANMQVFHRRTLP